NGNRPCGLHSGIDELEGIEGSDPKLFDRSRIGDPEGREPDQERQAHQPGIPEPSREPTSQYPQSLHTFSDISFDRIARKLPIETPWRPACQLPSCVSAESRPQAAC